MQLIAEFLKQPYQTRQATLADVSTDDIHALIAFLEEEIREREWDRRWDETLATPESDAYLNELEADLGVAKAEGRIKRLPPGGSLAKLTEPTNLRSIIFGFPNIYKNKQIRLSLFSRSILSITACTTNVLTRQKLGILFGSIGKDTVLWEQKMGLICMGTVLDLMTSICVD